MAASTTHDGPQPKAPGSAARQDHCGLTQREATDGSHHTATTSDGARERVDLPLTGMSCASCARRIEKALTAAPGVHRASVNFATSRATVEYDPKTTGVRPLMDLVREIGYGTAGTARADFVVDDSARPSGSSQPLEEHLNRLRGVVQATFNLGTMEVRVEYLPGEIDLPTVRKAIEDFGYRLADTPPDRAAPKAEAETSDQEARNAEYRDLQRKFWIAAVLSLPVLVIAMSHGRIAFLNFPGVNWLQLLLATPVVVYCGAQFYRGAWRAFRHRAADMNTLIAVGTGTAYVYSIAATVVPGFLAPASAGHTMEGLSGTATPMVPVYFEAAAVIIAPDPARPDAGIAGQGSHRRCHPPPDWFAG